MERILRGIMRYRNTTREQMVKEFQKVRDHPEPKAVFFTCMDSRMIPTRYTDTHVGDMFVVRNAGNVIPHAQHFQDEYFSCEPAALELGCVVNDIRHIIVCGHSDCKAMNLLYKLQCEDYSSQLNRRLSPLRSWMWTHANSSLEHFKAWRDDGMQGPLIFSSETPLRRFVAYIDPEDKFAMEDKLSQIHTLQQLSNVASYGFLKPRLESHDLHVHALWFDIYTGDVYYFSRGAKRFVPVDEGSVGKLTEEVRRYYS
ncbi:beta carbonic anhydrase 1 [Anastrepha ludens]|uniref:beta carbonic anhydrase 1 n=1 Tax=Anastrepha ludens TaxID=28586 RepID=UPI0023AE7D97|nr:beta carbonic anhydrase 1 [Anastrepha ludens]XP_053960048.1 beta carbonic anhydrase 1 [Anastrepha ludens]